MDELQTVAQVFEFAKRVRAAFIDHADIDKGFTLGAILDFAFDPPKSNVFLEIAPAVMSFSLRNVELDVQAPDGLSESDLRRWEKERDEEQYQVLPSTQLSRLAPAFWSERAAEVI